MPFPTRRLSLLLVTAVWLPAGAAQACSYGIVSLERRMEIADAVFVGTTTDTLLPWPVALNPDSETAWLAASATGGAVLTRVRVEEVWKGDVPREVLVDGGLPFSGSCDPGALPLGERLMFFTFADDDGGYHVSRTVYPYGDDVLAEAVTILGHGRRDLPEPPWSAMIRPGWKILG